MTHLRDKSLVTRSANVEVDMCGSHSGTVERCENVTRARVNGNRVWGGAKSLEGKGTIGGRCKETSVVVGGLLFILRVIVAYSEIASDHQHFAYFQLLKRAYKLLTIGCSVPNIHNRARNGLAIDVCNLAMHVRRLALVTLLVGQMVVLDNVSAIFVLWRTLAVEGAQDGTVCRLDSRLASRLDRCPLGSLMCHRIKQGLEAETNFFSGNQFSCLIGGAKKRKEPCMQHSHIADQDHLIALVARVLSTLDELLNP